MKLNSILAHQINLQIGITDSQDSTGDVSQTDPSSNGETTGEQDNLYTNDITGTDSQNEIASENEETSNDEQNTITEDISSQPTSSTSSTVSGVTNISNTSTVTNILSIILIVVGILLVFLAIAILIRLFHN